MCHLNEYLAKLHFNREELYHEKTFVSLTLTIVFCVLALVLSTPYTARTATNELTTFSQSV